MTTPDSPNSKLYILLPAYNEETALRRLIPDIDEVARSMGMPYEVVLVDDGSRDGTPAVVQELSPRVPLRHLRHATNQGYGAALNTGYTWIVLHAQPQDLVISLDADNTHSPAYFPSMVQKLMEGYDVVTCSYSMPGGKASGIPPKRRLFSKVANLIFRLGFHVPGTLSYTNGFRVYRVGILQRTYSRYHDPLINETGFPGGTELLLKVSREGARTAEVPFTLHYENRGADSKIRVTRTIFCYLKLLATYGGRRH
ncbi:MAG: glycosyltransferase family 2 protein [Elusimicrobiota bacterium]|jgi:dolichol-phosphate mannosyltransferase